MKCPHCNQEHPDGTKFCPFEGKEIQPQLKNCPNPECINHGKYNLPINYVFCPLCNSHLSEKDGDGLENDEADDFDLEISARGAAIHKAATILREIIITEGGPISLDEAYSELHNTCYMSQIERSEALNTKSRLEATGAKVVMKPFKYYVCDECGATFREIVKPKRCKRCGSHSHGISHVKREYVTFCPECGSYKMNYLNREKLYKCADCGMYSTAEEVNVFNNKP